MPIYEGNEEPDYDNPTLTPDYPVIKIIIQDEGVYQFTQADIQMITNGIGDIQNAELYHRGKPYPTWVNETNRQTEIRFYAPKPNSRYTSSGIYWIYFRNFPVARLTRGMLPKADSSNSAEFVTTESVYEENLIYEPISSEEFPWFWEKIPSGKTLEIDLQPSPKLMSGDRLRFRFWAKTEGQIAIDERYPHAVGLFAENSFLGEFHWNGSGFYEFDVLIDPGIPESQYHSLHIQSSAQSPDANDVVWLDRITIYADRILDPAVTPMNFLDSNGEVSTVVEPENTIIVFRHGLPVKIFNVQATDQSSSLVTLFTQAGDTCLLFAEKDVRKPDAIMRIVGPRTSKLTIDQSPNYLILGLDEYFRAAQQLLEWRSAQGFNVAYVSMDEIADYFGYGYPEPEAIRNFLAEIQQQSKARQMYVLLLGDFSHSRQPIRLDTGLTFVPSEMIYTELGGWTVSDTALVDFDQNGIPDIPIGRLPVTDIKQAISSVQKIVEYETGAASRPLSYLPVTDSPDSLFTQTAETFSDQFKRTGVPEKKGALPIVKNQEALLQTLRDHSVSLIVFFGHGSLTQLGEPSIIDIELDMNSTDPAILVAFTCLAGYFAHPDQISLMENFLFSETGGFVAGLSPTSLILMENQESLVISLSRYLSESPDSRLGDLFLHSLEEAWNDAGSIDLLRTFLILGDPALLISGSS